MKKVILSLLCLLCVVSYGFAYNNELNDFYQKLKTCTPGEYNITGTNMKIYGMNNGLCRFNISSPGTTTVSNRYTGESINASNCNYNVPLHVAQQFADANIEFTRAITEGNITESQAENIGQTLWNITKNYCK